jgi:hypothetical protein
VASVFGPAADGAFDQAADTERVLACAKLVERTGGKAFELGYLHEDVANWRDAGWWAVAEWRGTKITSGSEHRSPGEAADALATRLLDGGQCKCGKITSTNPAGVQGGDRTTLLGEQFTYEQQVAAGVCVWRRDGDQWKPGCTAPPRALSTEERKRLRG